MEVQREIRVAVREAVMAGACRHAASRKGASATDWRLTAEACSRRSRAALKMLSLSPERHD
jgi:hypothetical protein